MGANQSSIPEKSDGSFEPLDEIGSPGIDNRSSQLESPIAVSPSGVKTRFSLQNLPRSFSTSLHSSSVTPEPPSRQFSLLSRLTSKSTTSLGSDPHQPHGNTRAVSRLGHRQMARTGGIVTVNPGRLRAHSYTDMTSLSHHEGTGRTVEELHRQFKRLPMFEPLIPTTNANINTLLNTLPKRSATDKCVPRFQHNFNSDQLVEITRCYADYLHQAAVRVSQQQTELVGLQNKVDYDVRRIAALLAARVRGTPPPAHFQADRCSNSSLIPSGSTNIENPSVHAIGSSQHRLAGARQVDSVVLQTSQLSSLIDQCTLIAQEALQSIDDLNDRLPQSERLRWSSGTEGAGAVIQ